MISVLIECRNAEEPLATTLAALVPGAVDGLVREVAVLDRGSTDGSREVADGAGCRIIEDAGLREAIGSLRSDWLFLLEPGARPLAGWIERVREHIVSSQTPARLTPARDHRPSFFARLRRLDPPLRYGLILPKRQAAANARDGQSLESLARGLAVRRLDCEIVPAGR
jgi:glycosyltransferase involved in cell wall biosynthesis